MKASSIPVYGSRTPRQQNMLRQVFLHRGREPLALVLTETSGCVMGLRAGHPFYARSVKPAAASHQAGYQCCHAKTAGNQEAFCGCSIAFHVEISSGFSQ